MQVAERILVALDVPTLKQAEVLVDRLGPSVGGFKVGLELLTSAGAPAVVQQLRGSGRPLFFDGKFKDIPNTVAGAAKAVAQLGVAMFNVHALGGVPMMQAAVRAAEEGAAAAGWSRPKVLAVTVLTSLTPELLGAVGFEGIRTGDALQQLVVLLARRAQEAGCDGVVASPQEIGAIRRACGKNLLIVTPGVRPAWATTGDQQRFTTPREAVAAGADYLVIGRPITAPPPEVGDPVTAAQRIAKELAG